MSFTPSPTVAAIMARREVLEQQISAVDARLFQLETSYLEQARDLGSVLPFSDGKPAIPVSRTMEPSTPKPGDKRKREDDLGSAEAGSERLTFARGGPASTLDRLFTLSSSTGLDSALRALHHRRGRGAKHLESM